MLLACVVRFSNAAFLGKEKEVPPQARWGGSMRATTRTCERRLDSVFCAMRNGERCVVYGVCGIRIVCICDCSLAAAFIQHIAL